MGKKKIIGIVAAAVVALMLVAVGIWWFLGRTPVETGGNRLGVEWYDVNGKEFTITTADQLYELAELSNYYDFKNQTIKLGADIVVNEGNAADWAEKAPARKWSAITGFGGVFDGQGHTISGLYAKGYDAAIALFINTMSGAEIKDFKLTNTYFESAGFGGVASITSNGGGKYKQIYSDATLAVVGGYSGYAGGICSKLNLQTTIEECWYDGVINTTGRDAGGIVDNVLGSRVTISHSLFSGEINGTWDYSGTRYGGLVGRVYKTGAGLVLNDSLSTGKITSASVYYTGSVVGASMGNTSLTSTDTYGSQGSYDVSIGRSGANGTINSSPLELREKELIGAKAYQWTNLDFNKYWAIVENDTPILQHFAEEVPSVAGLEKAFDTSWYTEGATEFVITDLADLYGLYFLSASNTFSGKTIKVGADIVINEGKAKTYAETEPEYAWYPVMKFGGTFDGQGHTISGLYLNTSGEKVGFFKETTMEATVKNLSLKNSYMINTSTTNVFMGGISGRGGGTFDTIYSDAIMVSYGSIVGGIFGQVNAEARNTFTNCWFDGSIALKGETARYVGGIAGGSVKGNTTFAHCLNTAPISCEFKDAGMFVGGIAGYIINEGVVAAITDCMNAGKITVDYHVCVGSIVGRLNKAAVTISDTYATTESYTYSDGTFRGIGTSSNGYIGGVANFPEALISGMGGYQWTTLNFKDYWTVVTGPDGTPILKSFANKVPSVAGVAKKIDISWYSADKKEFVLKDLEDLYGFYVVSGFDTFLEKTVKLGADIIVNAGNATEWATVAPANPWLPINSFKGTFDGQGHTISGVYLKTDKTYTGLFSKTTKESAIKNLKLTNSYFENTIANEMAAFGSVAGQMGGVLDTVYSDAIVVGYGTQIGGLVGRVNHGALEKYKMTNCWFDGSVNVHNKEAAMAYVGGLAGGLIQGYLNMDNCLNTGAVTYTFDKLPLNSKGETWYIGTHVGGLMGGIMNGVAYNDDGSLKRVSEWNVSDSLNAGLITAGLPDGAKMPNGSTFANGAGSILGYTTKGTVNLNNVYATTESCKTRTMQYNTKTAVISGGAMKVSEEVLAGVGAYQLTDLDFSKYWAAIVNPDGTPVLKSFANAANVANLDGVKKLADFSWYDKSATTYTLDTMEKLYGFAIISGSDNFKGKTVKLGANITVNSGDASMWATSAPANEWIPISTFAGTFDGNGKTISGLYVNADETYAGLFAQTTNTSTIKDLIITNSYFNSTADIAALGSVAGQMGGTLDTVYSNAIVTSTGTQTGGLIGRVNQSALAEYKITNCWFDGKVSVTTDEAEMTYTGGIVGGLIQGYLNMDNCLNTGEVSYTYGKMPEGVKRRGVLVGGLVGGVMNGLKKNEDGSLEQVSELNLSDSLNTGLVHAQQADGSAHPSNDGVRATVGYTTSGTIKLKNVYATTESGTAKPQGGDNAKIEGSVASISAENLKGASAIKVMLLDFNKYWSTREANLPALKSFASGLDITSAMKADTSWYYNTTADGSANNPYIIYDVEDLYGFTALVNNGITFKGLTVKLGNNIDVNEGWTAGSKAPANAWLPIGNSSTSFQGTFDGVNNTISGIYVKTNEQYAGLFGKTINATIKDLRLENSYFENTIANGDAIMGSIVGSADGTLTNVYSDAIVKSTSRIVGGLVGRVTESDKDNSTLDMTNSWFNGTIDVVYENKNALYLGGLIGYLVHGTTTIDTCLYTGSLAFDFTTTNPDQATYGARVGALVGADNGENASVAIENCLSAGNMSGTFERSDTKTDISQFGGIMGYITSADTSISEAYSTISISKNITVDNAEEGEQPDLENKESKITTLYNTNSSANKANLSANNKWAGYTTSLYGYGGRIATTLAFSASERNAGKKDGIWFIRENAVPVPNGLQDMEIVADEIEVADVPNEYAWIFSTLGTDENPYLISNETELYGFVSLVNDHGNTFKTKTVKSNASEFVLNTGTENYTLDNWRNVSGLNEWTPIGPVDSHTDTTTAFQGTFDGNNVVIKGLYIDNTGSDATDHMGLFGCIVNGSVKNLSLKDSYIKTEKQFTGSIVGRGDGTLENIYSNAIIDSTNVQVGGILGRVQESKKSNTSLKMNKCWFDGDIYVNYEGGSSTISTGGLVGSAIFGTTTIDDSLVTGDITFVAEPIVESTKNSVTYNARVGGLVGHDNGNNASVSMENCVNASTITGTFVKSTDEKNKATKMAQVGSVIGNAGSSNTSLTNVYTTTESYTTAVGNGSVKPYVVAEQSIYGAGGYRLDKLNFDENWVAREGNVPALQGFAEDDLVSKDYIKADTSWVESEPYVIDSKEDLYGLSMLVSAGTTFEGKVIKVADGVEKIDLTGSVWNPIGNHTYAFQGTFDGNGVEIKGITVNTNADYVGLFGHVGSNGTVQNLSLTNTTINNVDGDYTGSVVGWLEGNMTGVYSSATVNVTATNVESDKDIFSAVETGGLVGRFEGNNQSKISNSWFAGSVSSNDQHCGGIVGRVNGNKAIENCLNTGTITSSCTVANIGYVGGLVGGVIKDDIEPHLDITNCLVAGSIRAYAKGGVGSVVGRSTNVGSVEEPSVTLTNVYTTNDCSNNNPTPTTIDQTAAVTGFGNYSVNQATVVGAVQVLTTGELAGEEAYVNTELDFYSNSNTNGVWLAVNDATPVLKMFEKYVSGTTISDLSNYHHRVSTGWYYNNFTYKYASKEVTQVTTEFTITDVDDFYGFADVVNDGVDTFEGKTVTLAGDMIINDSTKWSATATTVNEPDNVWTPIGTGTNASKATSAFKGIFNGNSKTISGVYVDSSSETIYEGLFGYTANCVIKNFTLSNSYFTGSASAIGAIAGDGDGEFRDIYCTDSVVINTTTTSTIGGIIARVQDPIVDNSDKVGETSCTVTNCWFAGSIIQNISTSSSTSPISGGMVGYAVHGTTVISNCLYTGEIEMAFKYTGTKTDRTASAGGLCGRSNAGSNAILEIMDSLSAGKSAIKVDTSKSSKTVPAYKGAIVGYATATKSGIKDSEIREVYTNVYGTTDCCATSVGSKTAVATISTVTMDSAADFYGTVTKLNTTYWLKQDGSLPTLKHFTTSRSYPEEMAWFFEHDGTETDPYIISDAGDLKELSTLVNDIGITFREKVVKLGNDITVNTGTSSYVTKDLWEEAITANKVEAFTSIGNAKRSFQGTFDGAGKTIQGLYVNGSTYVGLFGHTRDSEIKNLVLKNSYLKGTGTSATNMGSIVGYGEGILENIYSDAIMVCAGQRVSGIIGAIQDGRFYSTAQTNCEITNCCYDGIIYSTKAAEVYGGGLVGYALHGSATINNCIFTGEISCVDKAARVGGLIGHDNGTAVTLVISNSVSAGKISCPTAKEMGTIIGRTSGTPTINDNVYATTYIVSGTTLDAYGAEKTSGQNAVNISVSNISDNAVTNLNKGVADNGDWDTWELKDNIPVLKSFKDLITIE